MIFIIGGTSRAGKSTIAETLAIKYGYSYIPLDLLMTTLIKIDNPLLIDYKNDSDLIAKQMWPFTNALIKELLSQKDIHYILEGISFWPDLLHQESYFKKIKVCFVGYTQINTNLKLQQLRNNSFKNNSWHNNFSDEELIDQIDNIKLIGMRLKKSCDKNNFKYFESLNSIEYLIEEVDNYLFSETVLFKENI